MVPALIEVQTAPAAQGAIISGHGQVQQIESLVTSEYNLEVAVLVGSFIYFDIISCASARSYHALPLDHKVLLERADIHLETLTGCQNWAISYILEVSMLDSWRKEAERSRQLSIVELARRGGEIEKRLRQRLADSENNLSMKLFELTPAPTCEITNLFALSTMTYLHVVMSGAYPELPEVRESVSKTVYYFQRLTDPKLLRHVVWPFCITGCLALEGQQAIFRDLLSAAEITESSIGTCFEAFRVVEECWKSREANCDWGSAMGKLGRYILLS